MSSPDLPDAFGDADPQDGAEAFDESVLEDGLQAGRMRTFEEVDDVLDVTRAVGDRDDEEAIALDADEFDEDAVGEADLEEDDELDYHAATEEHEDDLDGLGVQDSLGGGAFASEIEGLEEVRDAGEAEGGEDDFTDFSARDLDDEDLKSMGYAEERDGRTRSKPG